MRRIGASAGRLLEIHRYELPFYRRMHKVLGYGTAPARAPAKAVHKGCTCLWWAVGGWVHAGHGTVTHGHTCGCANVEQCGAGKDCACSKHCAGCCHYISVCPPHHRPCVCYAGVHTSHHISRCPFQQHETITANQCVSIIQVSLTSYHSTTGCPSYLTSVLVPHLTRMRPSHLTNVRPIHITTMFQPHLIRKCPSHLISVCSSHPIMMCSSHLIKTCASHLSRMCQSHLSSTYPSYLTMMYPPHLTSMCPFDLTSTCPPQNPECTFAPVSACSCPMVGGQGRVMSPSPGSFALILPLSISRPQNCRCCRRPRIAKP